MKNVEKIIAEIAIRKFRVETLEERKMDRLDFYEVHIGAIREALLEAFQAGAASVK